MYKMSKIHKAFPNDVTNQQAGPLNHNMCTKLDSSSKQ
uniref:Uncharacterized protein n=1 Tax=Lepeophtheirus salmonis TaxID=72036 RepID=A0A0K2U5L7_LEPSM